MEGRADQAKVREIQQSPDSLAAYLEGCGVEKTVLVSYVSPDVIGYRFDANAFMARWRDARPERFLACGSVHPRFIERGSLEADLDYVLGELRLDALKIHPPHQLFHPNAYRNGMPETALLYEKALEYGVPVVIHTGTSIFPGARNVYSGAMAVDDVAVDFPALKILIAHAGRPLHMEECFFLVRRHENVFTDVSGIPPAKLPEYLPRLPDIVEKTLWGTDWPGPGVPDVRKNIEAFLSLPYPEDMKRKILRDNARKVFGDKAQKEQR
jgi:hypothetical protein